MVPATENSSDGFGDGALDDSPLEAPTEEAVRKARLRVIAKRIAEMRRDRGWSQAELGRRAGLHRALINTTENEKSYPQRENLERIARALSVDVDSLTDEYAKADMHRAPAALSIKEAKGRPGCAWIQVNRLVRSSTAVKVYQLIADDDAEPSERG